jgi:ATP-dependent phosphofructokinase / diphosphate-dependent phosphofructokinase
MLNRIGVLTSGGDSPGENALLKWIVKHTLEEKVANEVIGIRDGWGGLLNEDTLVLDKNVVRLWDYEGGTNIGSSRTNPFKQGTDDISKLLGNIQKIGLDYLIVIGGDGSLKGAHTLHQQGVKVIGIPQTIDKDILHTDYTIGFASAVSGNMEEIDKLRTTARSHSTNHIIEVMGNNSGHLALSSGVAGSAAIILIPEYRAQLSHIAECLRERRRKGASYDIIVVTETASFMDASGKTIKQKKGQVGNYLAEKLQEMTGYQTRSTNPGHSQRGGSPQLYDVLMSRKFGIAAVDMIKNRLAGQMAAYQKGRFVPVPLSDVIKGNSTVDVAKFYDTEKLTAKKTADFPVF